MTTFQAAGRACRLPNLYGVSAVFDRFPFRSSLDRVRRASVVTTFFRNGLHWLGASFATGQIQHMDQIIAVPAWTGNFLMLVGGIWAYGRLAEKNRRDLTRFVLALILTTAFFAADVAVFQPRYLPLFRRALHPHSPFAVVALSPRSLL